MTDKNSMTIEKIIIKGVTKEGNKFRPSDWAERLYYTLATYDQKGQPVFNPLVNLKQGERFKCFVINPKLEDEHPMTFDFLINFANSNNLSVTDQDDNPIDL
ncbi:MAG: DUF3579 domain-containing protein [Gammaproteobacteria bacterium]